MEEPVQLDEQAIRERAYEISLRADGGSPEENWRRAREELLDEQWAAARLTRAADEEEPAGAAPEETPRPLA
jgi:hypothetical protein